MRFPLNGVAALHFLPSVVGSSPLGAAGAPARPSARTECRPLRQTHPGNGLRRTKPSLSIPMTSVAMLSGHWACDTSACLVDRRARALTSVRPGRPPLVRDPGLIADPRRIDDYARESHDIPGRPGRRVADRCVARGRAVSGEHRLRAGADGTDRAEPHAVRRLHEPRTVRVREARHECIERRRSCGRCAVHAPIERARRHPRERRARELRLELRRTNGVRPGRRRMRGQSDGGQHRRLAL